MVKYLKKLFGNNITEVNSMEGEDTNLDNPIEFDDTYVSPLMELDFYHNFAIYDKEKQQELMNQFLHYIQGQSKRLVFINNVRAILANGCGCFNSISLQIIQYMEYLIKHNNHKIEEIYDVLIHGHYSDSIDIAFYKLYVKLDKQQQCLVSVELTKYAQGQEGRYMLFENLHAVLSEQDGEESVKGDLFLHILKYVTEYHYDKIREWFL